MSSIGTNGSSMPDGSVSLPPFEVGLDVGEVSLPGLLPFGFFDSLGAGGTTITSPSPSSVGKSCGAAVVVVDVVPDVLLSPGSLVLSTVPLDVDFDPEASVEFELEEEEDPDGGTIVLPSSSVSTAVVVEEADGSEGSEVSDGSDGSEGSEGGVIVFPSESVATVPETVVVDVASESPDFLLQLRSAITTIRMMSTSASDEIRIIVFLFSFIFLSNRCP